MRTKNLLSSFFSLLIWAYSTTAQAGLIINQFAADLDPSAYTASSTYLGELPGNAFNGTGPWNAGFFGTHWIQADMGSVQTLTQIKLTTRQSPNDVTDHKVYLSNSKFGGDYTTLTPIFSRNGFTANGTVLDITFDQDYSGQYLLILVNNGPTSWTALGDGLGRVNWVQTAPTGPNVSIPEPTTIAIFTLGVIGLVSRRFNKQ